MAQLKTELLLVEGPQGERQVASRPTRCEWRANCATPSKRSNRRRRDSSRRPTPRYFEPMEPMLAVRGVKRSLRHRFDRHRSPDGRLQCRWPSQVSTEIKGLVQRRRSRRRLPRRRPAAGSRAARRQRHDARSLHRALARRGGGEGRQLRCHRAVKNRMFAETALRFKKDGSFSAGGVTTGERTEALALSRSASSPEPQPLQPDRRRRSRSGRRHRLVAALGADVARMGSRDRHHRPARRLETRRRRSRDRRRQRAAGRHGAEDRRPQPAAYRRRRDARQRHRRPG